MRKVLSIIKKYTYIGNLLLFFLKILLSILTKSFAFIISALYNLGIGIAKKNTYKDNRNNYKIGLYVVLASIAFIIYSIWIIIFHKSTNYNMYIGLAIATITFVDIGYSIYGIIKNSKDNNNQNKVLMLVNLATALISLELTQSALLSFTQVGVDNSLYNGLIGIVVGVSSLIIGIIILFKKDN